MAQSPQSQKFLAFGCQDPGRRRFPHPSVCRQAHSFLYLICPLVLAAVLCFPPLCWLLRVASSDPHLGANSQTVISSHVAASLSVAFSRHRSFLNAKQILRD